MTDFRPKTSHSTEHCRVLPAESALKMDHEPHLNRQLTRGLMKSGGAPPRDRAFVKKMAIQGSVLSECLWPEREPGSGYREHE